MPKATQTRPLALALLGLLAGTADAADVFRTIDANGQPIYTDKPAVLPAERLKMAGRSSDRAAQQGTADAAQRSSAAGDAAQPSQKAAPSVPKTAELSAEDLATRCTEARGRHDQYMISQALYQTDPDTGERRYLTDTEIDAAREHAKKLVDEFCGA